MTTQSTITQGVQLGVESTPGTSVSASKKVNAFDVALTPVVPTKVEDASGYKAGVAMAVGLEHVTGKADGWLSYTQVVYPLSSLFGAATISTPAGSVKLWTWDPDVNAPLTPKTYTIERGDSGRAAKATYAVFTDLELAWSPEGIAMKSSLFAQELADGITLTAAPTELAADLAQPTDMDLFVDTTSAGLGGTALPVLSTTLKIGERYSPVKTSGSSEPSFSDVAERGIPVTVTAMVECDATGLAYLTTMRDASTRFLRWQVSGAEIQASYPYRFRADIAVKCTKVGELKDQDGVYAAELEFQGVYDVTWGSLLQLTVQNILAAL